MTFTYIRRLNERERENIMGRFPVDPRRQMLFRFFLVCLIGIFMGGGIILITNLDLSNEGNGIIVSVIFTLLLCLVFAYIANTTRDEKVKFTKEVLSDKKAEVLSVDASAVVLVSVSGYDTCFYFFDVGNQYILFLYPWLFPSEDLSSWPNDCFEIVRTVMHGAWLGVFTYGKRLEPIREITIPNTEDQFFAELIHAPVSLYEGSIDRLEEAIKNGPVWAWN